MDQAVLEQELRQRLLEPCTGASGCLTLKEAARFGGAQVAFLMSGSPVRLLEGGNQSGKTWTNCVDFILSARGVHPAETWVPPYAGASWKGWYSTRTFRLFAEQGWPHFKRLLLWPGESVLKLPTRAILKIGWNQKNPETPDYILLRRRDVGTAEIFIKSYEQGPGEFQTAEVDRLALDEECSQAIWDEAQPRVARRNGRITVSATPVLGVPWLGGLRAAAETDPQQVSHTRLSVRDNPAVSAESIKREEFAYRGRPEIARLRLDGFPVAMEGLVYSDLIFGAGHVVEPFHMGGEWTRFRVIDPGWRNFGVLWFAIAPGNRRIVLYRDYLGQERTPAANGAEVVRLSGAEAYHRTWIDPAAQGTDAAVGRSTLDLLNKPAACWVCGRKYGGAGDGGTGRAGELWCPICRFESGLKASVAPDNDVRAGIDAVCELLNQRIGLAGEWPLFCVFRTCTEFLRERREYKYREVRERGDESGDRVVKRADHLMDPWRYFVAARPRWMPVARAAPKAGSTAELLQRDRQARKLEVRR